MTSKFDDSLRSLANPLLAEVVLGEDRLGHKALFFQDQLVPGDHAGLVPKVDEELFCGSIHQGKAIKFLAIQDLRVKLLCLLDDLTAGIALHLG